MPRPASATPPIPHLDEATPTFEKDLERLINYHSMENGSDTPDFILAHFMRDSLLLFNSTVQKREKWYGREIHQKGPCESTSTPQSDSDPA
jgi:hypothetical protein